MRVAVVEQGWRLAHADLEHLRVPGSPDVLGSAFFLHGTACMCLVGGSASERGPAGVAPEVERIRPFTQWHDENYQPITQAFAAFSANQKVLYSTDAAIWRALRATDRQGKPFLRPGDILLLEAQTAFGGYYGLPVEVEPGVRESIRHAVDERGVVVIEAAGNGAYDLDTVELCGFRPFGRPRGRDRHGAFSWRNGLDTDSGAIMVGGSVYFGPQAGSRLHRRMLSSNHGRRLDSFAQAIGVITGASDVHGSADTYLDNFSGTSAAAAILAGAAALVQSCARAERKKEPVHPRLLRELFRSRGTRHALLGTMPHVPEVIRMLRHM